MHHMTCFHHFDQSCASKSPGSHVGEARRACAGLANRGDAPTGAGRTSMREDAASPYKTSCRFSQRVYPSLTPPLKREHPVLVILIAPLASPNRGAPLRSTRKRAVKCASKTFPLQSKFGYESGSQRSSAAVCGLAAGVVATCGRERRRY